MIVHTAEEDAARRARIEERLTQSLGIKKKESANGTSRDKTASNEQKGTSQKIKSGEKQADKINMKQNDHRSTKQPQKITSKKFEGDKARPSLEPVNKTSEGSSSSRKVHKRPGKDKKGPPMDFKALLAMAERNKDGGGKLSTAMAQGGSKKHEKKSDVEEHVRKKEERVKKKEEHVKKSDRSSGQRKVLETKQASSRKPVSKGKTNGQMHSKGSLQFKGEGTPGKTQPSRQVQDSKQDLKHLELVNARRQTGIERKTLPSMEASTSHRKSVSSKTIQPNNDRMLMREGHVPKRRDRENLKRKRNPFEDEMDDFIDDGDGEEVDVSKYIKEIFGYDRTRFVMTYLPAILLKYSSNIHSGQ